MNGQKTKNALKGKDKPKNITSGIKNSSSRNTWTGMNKDLAMNFSQKNQKIATRIK